MTTLSDTEKNENLPVRKNVVAASLASTLLLQVITLISGLILPRVLISAFGSEMNGLVSSVTQILNYITLLEGGVGGVVTASLYRPLAENDLRKISGIVNATERFFRRVALIYVVYVAATALIYPSFLRGGESYWYIAALICVIGSSLFVQYFFSLTARLLLKADRHVTFLSLTQSLLILLNLLLVVASVRLFDDLLIVKAVSALVFFLQPLIYGIFIKRKYKLDKTVPPDTDSLRQRWSGFGQNLAFFIHTNTDIVILTLFMPLSAVSVYTVYFAVANSLKTLVAALSSAVIPSIGNIAAQDDKERTAGAFDLYEFAVSFITFVLFTCAILLIVPFVGVYTRGITDADYIQPVFGVLILVAEMLYCLRDPYVSIAYTAGHFRQTAPYAYAEAAINIVLSLLLVPRFGLIGVAAGTAVSMAVRMILQVLYTKNRIIMRPVSKCVSRLVVFGVASGASILLFKYVFPAADITDYGDWTLRAAEVSAVVLLMMTAAAALFFGKELKATATRLLGRRR